MLPNTIPLENRRTFTNFINVYVVDVGVRSKEERAFVRWPRHHECQPTPLVLEPVDAGFSWMLCGKPIHRLQHR